MANKIFHSILNEKIAAFRFAFEQTSKDIFWNEDKKQLTHPGEFGMYREAVCKELLRLFIPGRLEIGNGFLINDIGETSTQCDIIVYDKNSTPLIENNERQRFYPIETVSAIGEIKSNLDKAGLKSAINKLSKNKLMREKMTKPVSIRREIKGSFDPANYFFDHLFSFIICNKFTFDVNYLPEEIDSMYTNDTEPWLKHNLILSVNDGLLAYCDSNNMTMLYPYAKTTAFKNRLVISNNSNIHFHYFCSYLFLGTSSSSIYYPEVGNYMERVKGGKKIDQK
jgi:hypothetical protein